MPIYPFRCTACSHEFEVTRRMSEDTSRADCPSCGAESTRVFVAPTLTGRASASTPVSEAPAPTAGRGPGHAHGPGGHSH